MGEGVIVPITDFLRQEKPVYVGRPKERNLWKDSTMLGNWK